VVILEHFAAYTNLPIKISDIHGFIMDRGFVDEIAYHPIDEDPGTLAGMLYHIRASPPYRPYGSGRTIANVVYSTRLSRDAVRVILAKELMHIFDNGNYAAKTTEQVSRLVAEIALPASVKAELQKLSPAGQNDHNGILLGIAVLFPRDARDELRPLYPDKLGDEEISSIAEIPEAFVPLVMSEKWGEVLDLICST
jgi:Poly(A) polymerase